MQVALSSDIMSHIPLTFLGAVVAYAYPWVTISRQFDLNNGATWKKLYRLTR
jgi:hypothetical protein